ncbi:cytadherence high molecular weight protein 1-like [Clytia hemisphaerica]|uniref:Uncharacterized protein n=1 Tax=Clytia hemisphaerica TaxID=252671 RepID=A0A7M5XFE5_9CNID
MMVFDRFEEWERQNESKTQNNKGKNVKSYGIEEQYGIKKKKKEPAIPTTTTLDKFNQKIKKLNKHKKVENWLKSNDAIISVPKDTREKPKERKRSSSSVESSTKPAPPKNNKHIQMNTSSSKKPESSVAKKKKKDTILIESTDDDDISDTFQTYERKEVKVSRFKEEDVFDNFVNKSKVAPPIKRTISNPTTLREKQAKIPKKTQQNSSINLSVKKEIKSELSEVMVKTENHNSDEMDLYDNETQDSRQPIEVEETITVKKEVRSPQKRVMPASFILKPTTQAFTQTDIAANNLKELMKCEGVPDKLKSEAVFKFTVKLKNDQICQRVERKVFDSKKNNLASWFDYILDNYISKHEYEGEDGYNSFITMDSMFRVFSCDDEKKVPGMLEVLTDGSNEDNWMRGIREPIRIHTVIDRQLYGNILGNDAQRLPDLIITRLFPIDS